MSNGLPVSRLIRVSVTLSPQAARFPNFNTCLLLGTSDVIDVTTRIMEFSSLVAIAEAGFATDSQEYLSAQLWFAQTPQPDNILIGRWANAATAGQLFTGALAVANRVSSAWVGITTGAFKITIDGVGPQAVGNLDFSAETNMNGVASVITSGLPGGTAVCVWDAANARFVITSQTTGAASAISFLTSPDAGTDISGMMKGQSGEGGYQANGVAAETALDTVIYFDNRFSSQFYGLVMPSASDEDHLQIAAFVEASAPAHYYGITTQDPNTLIASDTSSLAYQLKAITGLDHTGIQFSSEDIGSRYAIMSFLARILTTNWQANNSTITLMYKGEPLVAAEFLTDTQADTLQNLYCNVFAEYNNETAIIQYGTSCSGNYVDSVIGVDWLRATIQASCYNLLYQSPTKIPQTDAGMHQLATQIESVCQQGVTNGLLAPGTWQSQGFGQLTPNSYLPKGFYVYAPPVATQTAADRRARKSVPFQVAAKLGGAVHEVDVAINVES